MVAKKGTVYFHKGYLHQIRFLKILVQSPTKSQTLSNECNFKMRPNQLAWFTNAFLRAVTTNGHKSKRCVEELKQR